MNNYVTWSVTHLIVIIYYTPNFVLVFLIIKTVNGVKKVSPLLLISNRKTTKRYAKIGLFNIFLSAKIRSFFSNKTEA